ncbi:MAG: EamA family transporter [Nostoc sp. TH1S01]|nr:EamA family transporter [Nostoc sp. TH1S01]
MLDNNEATSIFYALLSAFFAALTTIFAKIGVETINSNVATAIRTVVILIMVWGWVVAKGQLNTILTISSKTLLFLVLSGLSTGLSWLFYFRALQVGKASLVTPLDKSSLVLVLIFSVLFLQEPLTLPVILGTGLILIGTMILIR